MLQATISWHTDFTIKTKWAIFVGELSGWATTYTTCETVAVEFAFSYCRGRTGTDVKRTSWIWNMCVRNRKMVNYACKGKSPGDATWRRFRFQLVSRSQCSNSHGEHHIIVCATTPYFHRCEQKKMKSRRLGNVQFNDWKLATIVWPGLDRRAPDGCARWWGWVGRFLKRLVGFHHSVFNKFIWQDMVFQGFVATGAFRVASSDQCLENPSVQTREEKRFCEASVAGRGETMSSVGLWCLSMEIDFWR